MLIAREVLSPKQIRRYSVEYPWLADGETIIGVSTEIDRDDEIFNITELVIEIEGKSVSFLVDAGQSGENIAEEYVVTLTVSTTDSQQNVDEIRFIVSCGS